MAAPTITWLAAPSSHMLAASGGVERALGTFTGDASHTSGGEDVDMQTLAGFTNEPLFAHGYSTDGAHKVVWNPSDNKLRIYNIAGTEQSGDLSGKTYNIEVVANKG